jgi:hypothetical protein
VVTHLTADAYARLLDGTLPAEEAAALARHLEAPCAECEWLLAGRGGTDAVDAEVDRVLAALPTSGGAAGSDAEFARIERRLAARRRGARLRRILPLAAAAGAVAAALTALVLPRSPERPPWDGRKGAGAAAVPVQLRFVVVEGGAGEPPALEKGVSGSRVEASASLQLEVETGGPASVAVLRVAPGAAPELVWHERLPGGSAPVSVDGHPAAYPLAGLSGAQRFVAVASEEPLGPERLAEAAAARIAPEVAGRETLAPEVSLDVVEVEVR